MNCPMPCGAYGTNESDANMSFFAREATRWIRYCMSLPSTLVDEKSNDSLQDPSYECDTNRLGIGDHGI